MASILLYEDDIERKLHDRAVKRLAEDLSASEEEIRALYETELGRVKSHARIKDFLTVIVTREVKNLLRSARLGGVAGAK
jgi:hypothetical protein